MRRLKLFDLVGHYLPKIHPFDRIKVIYACGGKAYRDRKEIRLKIIELSKMTDGTLEGCLWYLEKENLEEI